MAVDLGTLIGSLLTGGYDLFRGFSGGSQGDIGRAREAAALADPFASQRPQYQEMLQGLLTKPGSFVADPGYQFALGQGQDAIQGAGNAIYGGTRAGAIYPELAKFTEGYAAQNYDNRINQLLRASGAESGSPGAAGAILAGGFDKQDQNIGAGLSSLLNGLLGGPSLQGLLGGNEGGLVGLISRLLSPSKNGMSGGTPSWNALSPSDAYRDFAGGDNPTPFTSLVPPGGGDPYGFGDPGGLNDFGGNNWTPDLSSYNDLGI